MFKSFRLSRDNMKKNLLVLFLLSGLIHLFVMPAAAATPEEFHAAFSRHLMCFPIQLVNINNQEISIINEKLCLATVYTAIGMQPLWVSEKGPGEKAALVLQSLEKADLQGLQPTDYNVKEIKSLWQTGKADELAQLETQLTLNFIKYAHDVSRGRIAPFQADPVLFAEAGDSHFKPALIVEQALAASDFAAYLAALPPSNSYYMKLRDALQSYRNIARAGGWPTVPAGETLHPGDRDKRIILVRRRLAGTAEITRSDDDTALYDEELVQAVKDFQKEFGLEPDGLIGRKTLAALNTSPEELINKIILNMDRWRWQKNDFGRRYIMVNIANFDLTAVADGRVVLQMAVIVGKEQHQTPVFSHNVQYVDFNPFWNVPPSIAQNEDLPELRKDPYYLVHRKVRLFSGWQDDAVELDSTTIDWQAVTGEQMKRFKLRQDPGPWNALGPVKLVFPNQFNVYIHGTPQQELFKHTSRSFSHGCIRASQPLELALFALSEENPPWSMEKIREIIARGERQVANISTPLPVYITYQTVWIDNSGIIHFNNDVYGRDAKLAEVLLAAPQEQRVTEK